jgi:hypothetical protein
MSKYYVHAQCRAMHDVQTMTSTELEQEYGIEIDVDDGTVWDPCEMKQFNTLDDWAAYMQEQEREDIALATSSLRGGNTKRRYEDD